MAANICGNSSFDTSTRLLRVWLVTNTTQATPTQPMEASRAVQTRRASTASESIQAGTSWGWSIAQTLQKECNAEQTIWI
jgi:hypothetical protein